MRDYTHVNRDLSRQRWRAEPGRAIVDGSNNIVAIAHARKRLDWNGPCYDSNNIEPADADRFAHLLAAAPALLEACEVALAHLQSYPSHFDDDGKSHQREALRARLLDAVREARNVQAQSVEVDDRR